MTGARTYLDHNASAPLRPAARAAAISALDRLGNPSSIHAEGRAARAVIEAARSQVAALVGAHARAVVFTGGATEAINTVLRGGFSTIFLSALEHDAVLQAARLSGARVIEVAARADGTIDLAALEQALMASEEPGRALLALQLANNETGAVQPVAAAARLARANGVALLTDAVQAAGRISIDVAELGSDFLVLSSHKIGGPKGAGALVIHDGRYVEPLIAGGGQEGRRRAGTENVPGIAGFGAAALEAASEAADTRSVAALRDRLEAEVRAITPHAVVFAADAPRLPNTCHFGIAGAAAETLVIQLDLAGIAVSAGAACSSGKVQRSRVLDAMGVPANLARAGLRISLGWNSTATDVDAFVEVWRGLSHRRETRSAA